MLFDKLNRIFAGLSLLALAGCFYSETPLIAAGEGVLPIDGDVQICGESCESTVVTGDGYAIVSQKDPDSYEGLVRFSPVLIAAHQQIYIAEIQLNEADTDRRLYAAARRRPQTSQAAHNIQIAVLDCEDLDAENYETMRADGWTIEISTSSVSCQPPSLDALKELLRGEADIEALADDAWWAEQNR